MKLTRYLSKEPIELDITPACWIRGSSRLGDGARLMARLHELADYTGVAGPPSAEWLISNSTGVRVDVREPNLRLYFLRAEGDTDEQIEMAREALVNELERKE